MHLLWYKSNIAEFAQSRLSFGNIFLEIFPLTLQSAFYFATELQMGELVRNARSLYTLAYSLHELLKYNDRSYMQKTCDVAEKAILAKKKLRKKCVNHDKM